MKREKIFQYQRAVLGALANKIDDFYLAGGTALSSFYFQHRLSVDLDFFTSDFVSTRVREIADYLKKNLKKEVRLAGQNLKGDKARVMVYGIHFTRRDILKIDFVEDSLGLIKRPRMVEGIKVMSLEDIYLRKIYAVIGMIPVLNKVGRRKFTGGRTEARDFYDLYCLSHTFMPLSRFVNKYGNPVVEEGLISWYRTYDRMQAIDGILTLITDKKIDCKQMEKHFKEEIDKIIARQLGEI